MATEKSFQLYINKDNVKHYFTASGGVLNGAQINTKYITMRTSSTTATFTMNDAGRDVLFPSAAAIAHKIDVWAQAIATLNNSKNTINVAIAGQNAITTERIHTSLNEYTGSVSGNFTKSNTSAIYVIKIANGFQAAGVRDTSITAYFTQYSCSANKAGKGVKNVSVSNAAPYEGETVTFSAELFKGASFEGWYSDEACTQLVSSSLTYSTTAADLTLYAKATIDATLYNVSAVAGSEIASVSVSDSIVPDGDTATFTAQVNTGCSFEAWYSDDTYTTIVSTENPYTATITANTTLYAKAYRNSFNMSVGSAEHGTASVSATTVPYGSDVTFTFTPEDETWELYGWYSDSALTQLVSEANPYTFTATEDVTLYPKVGKKRYTIKYGRDGDIFAGGSFQINIIVVDFNSLTHDEINYLRTGDYDNIDSSKIVARDSMKDSNAVTSSWKTIQCTYDMYIAVYLPEVTILGDPYYAIVTDGDKALAYWPYYWFQPTADATISSHNYNAVQACNCSSVAKDGIAYAYATTPTYQDRGAIFEAELFPGYTFSGWYSDEACTTLVSTDNPAKVITPKYTTDSASQTSLTLYAKATKAIYTIGVGTAEHGSATVSANTAYYGDTVTFNCTVDEGYEFNGWYSDEGLTQLVSDKVNYNHTVVGNIKLWPKVEIKIYNLILHPTGYDAINFSSNTKIENVECLYENDSHSFNSYAEWYINGETGNTSTNPASLAFYIAEEKFINIPDNAQITDINVLIKMGNDAITQLPKRAQLHGIYTAQRNIENSEVSYNQVGIKKYSDTEFSDTEIIPYTLTNAEVGSWTLATLKAGKFGIVLSASFDPRSIWVQAAPHIYNIDIFISYNLLPNASATGISLKLNGSWIKAKSVFKKTNGAWVQQNNPASLFTGSPSGTESNYLYLGE